MFKEFFQGIGYKNSLITKDKLDILHRRDYTTGTVVHVSEWCVCVSVPACLSVYMSACGCVCMQKPQEQ